MMAPPEPEEFLLLLKPPLPLGGCEPPLPTLPCRVISASLVSTRMDDPLGRDEMPLADWLPVAPISTSVTPLTLESMELERPLLFATTEPRWLWKGGGVPTGWL